MSSSAAADVPGGPAPARSNRSALRVVAQRNFGVFFAGAVLSNIGTWFQNIAQAILVYRLTGSSLFVGLVNLAQFSGVIFLFPWTGAAADRFNRRRLLVITQVAEAVITGTLAVLVALHEAAVPTVILFALALGVAAAFAGPAQQSLVPALVDRNDIGSATVMVSVSVNIARAVGPVLGVVVITSIGIASAFALNALSFLGLIAALLIVKIRDGSMAPRGRPRLRETLSMVRQSRVVLVLLVVVAAAAMCSDPVTTLGPQFATRVFHQADTAAGWIVGAFGAGAVLAAVLSRSNRERPYLRMLATVLAMGGGLAGFALAPGLGFGLGALAVMGFGYLATHTSATTELQLTVSDAERGRVMALWGIAFGGTRPLGSLIDGTLAGPLGARGAALVMTTPLALTSVLLVAGGYWRRASALKSGVSQTAGTYTTT
jgi:MFS family permease